MIGPASTEPDSELLCGLTPAERILVWAPDKVGDLSPLDQAILSAFELGNGPGLLQLGTGTDGVGMLPGLGFWRELAQAYVSQVCAGLHPTSQPALSLPPMEAAELARWAGAAPPMRGSELVSVALLQRMCTWLGQAIAACADEYETGFAGYLESQHSHLHVAGRVCLHLAENKANPALPFAFLATYARNIPGSKELQYVPLNRALKEYAGRGNRHQLLALLTPLQRAAQRSPLVRELIDSGNIYHPLAWTAEQAYAFLNQSDELDHAGLVLRLPEWWHAKSSSRPMVSVTLGEIEPTRMGLEALLDFDMELTLGGSSLSEEEIQELLRGEAGLLRLRGKWVHVDPERLQAVLDHWNGVQQRAQRDGLAFSESMRLLAGAELAPVEQERCERRPEWSRVNAGSWLGQQLDALRAPLVLGTIERNAGLHAELRGYQKLGVQWLWTLYGLGLGGCLADDMGLGKTIQVIALLAMLRDKRLKQRKPLSAASDECDLLIVPASLLTNWHEELARFAPKLKPLIAHPSSIPSRELKLMGEAEVARHGLVITTYGTAVRTPWISAFPWRCIVLDEAQAIKNPGAKQTRAIKKLHSSWRLALTGTPVENRLDDLWSIFDFLNPGLLGAARPFAALCKSMAKGKGDGFQPLRKLVAPYIMRRMKTDKSIISDLPDKTELSTYCLLSRAQAALYKESVAELKSALKSAEGIARRGLVLSYLMRFKQICNHPSHWLNDDDFEPSASGKFQRIGELVSSIAARQEKALVFTQFARLTEPLAEHLAQCFGSPGLVLHGGTPIKSRQKLVRRFQEQEELPFLVLSLKAGGSGLNLTAANHVIHFDRWWNPAVENQATDRAFRIGQKRNVLVHKFVCKGTIEERIDRLISSKQKLSDEILNVGAEKELTELSNEELIAMVSLDIQSAVSQ